VRPEIQALRAIAVLLVVIYHFWPAWMPGGYAGVDVFFVISGFLITRHLVTEAGRRGKIALVSFWARRARRLLPASLLIIAISAIGTALWVPRTLWDQFSKEMAASAFYVVNWQLARDSVDYLGAENDASPVQHYWSLSVEEQFYLVWPLLILLALMIAARFTLDGGHRRVAILVLSIVTVISLAVSIVLTQTDAPLAYFVTPTRVWEFGVGGILGILATRLASVSVTRAVVGWAGVAGIVATGLFYNAQTQFPGYLAAVPVASTAAVIWAGGSVLAWSSTALSRLRPAGLLGGVSYSLYLWHWPLIVIVPFALGRELNALDRWILLVSSIVLAWMTKRYVEDVMRTNPVLTARGPRLTLLLTAAGMVAACVVPAATFLSSRSDIAASKVEVAGYLTSERDCLGAAAMLAAPCDDPAMAGVLIPRLAALKDDKGDAYACYPGVPPSGKLLECASWGSERPDAVRVAIQGDSHGAMLTQALIPLLEDLNWHLDAYNAQGCRWRTIERSPGSAPPKPNQTDADCADFRPAVNDRFLTAQRYDVILVTGYRGVDVTAQQVDTLAADQSAVWTPVVERGTRVIAIADNPAVPDALSNCVIEDVTKGRDGSRCVIPEVEGMNSPDSMALTVARTPGADLIDLSDLYCVDGGCPMIIGNVITYRDSHHLSATYAKTVAPILVDRVLQLVGTPPD